MTPLDIFLNRHDRLRSGWRFAVFAALYLAAASAIAVTITFLTRMTPTSGAQPLSQLPGWLVYLLTFLIQFVPAVLLGWGCGRLFEDLPLSAQGWTTHRGWLRNFLLGSLIGAAALALAALVGTICGGFHYSLTTTLASSAFIKTFFGACGVYVLLAAGEEALFRGYPLQTMLRSLPFLIAVLPTSLIFAAGHFANPNVPHNYLLAIQFVNTALAGVWLSIGYWRTRSMWLPLGLHWAWNWTMGSLLGLPVSGITSLTRAPLLRATDRGPVWLTGGAYGLEGGLACTLALVIAIIYLWRTRLLKPVAELRRYTDGEQPKAATYGDMDESAIKQIV
ncbi:MAG: CPBP family intramembrane glutamic endopeptidase [Pyrinomonadaceae bacterium]